MLQHDHAEKLTAREEGWVSIQDFLREQSRRGKVQICAALIVDVDPQYSNPVAVGVRCLPKCFALQRQSSSSCSACSPPALYCLCSVLARCCASLGFRSPTHCRCSLAGDRAQTHHRNPLHIAPGWVTSQQKGKHPYTATIGVSEPLHKSHSPCSHCLLRY